MYGTMAKDSFWAFDSMIMQNLTEILPLFCTATWPLNHVSENQGYHFRRKQLYIHLKENLDTTRVLIGQNLQGYAIAPVNRKFLLLTIVLEKQ